MAKMVLFLTDAPKSRDELFVYAGLKKHRDTIRRYIEPLEHIGWVVKTIPDKPTSPRQKYMLTEHSISAVTTRQRGGIPS